MSEPKPLRPDGTPLPARGPDGWVHLSEAVAKFAAAFLGAKWEDLFVPCLSIGQPSPAPTNDEERHAEELAHYIAEQFVDACRFEFLTTGYLRVGSRGAVEPMPAEWWDTEDVFLRFRTWSVDPEDELSNRLDLPCWIWVEEASLKRVCDQAFRKLNNIKVVHFAEARHRIGVVAALDLLRPFLPHLTGDVRAPGGPDGAKELLDALASGAVSAVASRMERRSDPSGRGTGRLIEAQNDCPVPADLWKAVELSPLQNWAAGTFIAKPNARNTITLERVLVDELDLAHYLEAMGLLHRVQYRRKGEDEPFAEGFTPAFPVADEPDNSGAEDGSNVVPLFGPPEESAAPSQTARAYQRQAKEPPALKVLRKFMLHAKASGWLDRGGPDYRSMEMMLPDYQLMCRKMKPTPVKPYAHSAFNKWVGRFIKGEWS